MSVAEKVLAFFATQIQHHKQAALQHKAAADDALAAFEVEQHEYQRAQETYEQVKAIIESEQPASTGQPAGATVEDAPH